MPPVCKKWSAMAACLCIIVAAAITIPNVKNGNTSGTLMDTPSEYHIAAQAISNPVFVASQEIPRIIKDEIYSQ
jgi:hypothetical protein